MEVPFRLVDVFTDVPYAGNQLCVVPDPPAGLEGATMLMLAREIGFSETTFVTALRPDGYDVRIFTPAAELPFAGHPTLGTAYSLVHEGRLGSPLTQTSPAGEVPVEISLEAARGWMRQLPPVVGRPVQERAAVAAAAGLGAGDLVAGLPVVPISTGIPHLMVPVRDEATLRRAFRGGRCEEVCAAADESESLYLFAVRGDGDIVARMFDRHATIGEDPATGSAAGPLGAYLTIHGLAGLPGATVVAQGEMVGRPSQIHVEVASGDDGLVIRVGGGVRIVGSGAFVL